MTHRLGGENYVLWGGREGYETLLNTDLKRELDQLGRFMHHGGRSTSTRSASRARILIEPKPNEPTKHQYDFDVAAVYALPAALRPRQAKSRSTSRSTTPRSPATTSSTRSPCAQALGIFGSIDANRGDPCSAGTPTSSPMNVAAR